MLLTYTYANSIVFVVKIESGPRGALTLSLQRAFDLCNGKFFNVFTM